MSTTMWPWARVSLAVTVALDALLLVGILAGRKAGTYEADMLTAYFVGVVVAVQVVLCIVGLLLDRGRWQRYVYPAHVLASVTVFVAAELGGFRVG